MRGWEIREALDTLADAKADYALTLREVAEALEREAA